MKLKTILGGLALMLTLHGNNTNASETNTAVTIPVVTETPAEAPKPKTTCEQVIQACDAALDAKAKEIDFSVRVIDTQSTEIDRLRVDLVREREKNDSLLRNPAILLLLGAVAGAFIAR